MHMNLSIPLIFLSQAGWVFLLTVQQANVHRNRKLWAFINSFAIGLCQLAGLWFIPHATSVAEFAAFLLAGPVAVVAGMLAHPPVKVPTPSQEYEEKQRAANQRVRDGDYMALPITTWDSLPPEVQHKILQKVQLTQEELDKDHVRWLRNFLDTHPDSE